jgi:GTP-binding protein HflX
VGFIRKLPHQLIESFKSTLDETREADLLLHIVDISHPQFESQYNTVRQTLEEIGAGGKPVIVVFNKIDAYKARTARPARPRAEAGRPVHAWRNWSTRGCHALRIRTRTTMKRSSFPLRGRTTLMRCGS